MYMQLLITIIIIIIIIIIITSNNQRLHLGWQQSKVKMLLLQCCALCKFHATDSQNTRDQIASGRSSKCVWSNCVLCIPYILSGSPNKCGLHTCDGCVITTWRLGWRAPLVTHDNNNVDDADADDDDDNHDNNDDTVELWTPISIKVHVGGSITAMLPVTCNLFSCT